MNPDIKKTIKKFSPLERKIISLLKYPLKDIILKSRLDNTSILRALNLLEKKNILKLKKDKKQIVDLGVNGIYYKKNYMPERKLLIALEKVKSSSLKELKEKSNLSNNEFKASIGILKRKDFIEVKEGKIFLTATKEEILKKLPEEELLERLPVYVDELKDLQLLALENLKKRKDIIEIKEKNIVNFELTDLGKKIAGKKIKVDLLEEVTPKLIKTWENDKKFRVYDIKSKVPEINGGKKHFVNEAIDYAKKIWFDLGFKEMEGNLIQTSFWNFDALFTAQDHPVRDMHDTFFIEDIEGELPDKNLLDSVKKAHEEGIEKSRGWEYKWKESEAKKIVLRTHTTCLSAQTLYNLKKEDLPAKFFAIGKTFRNETIDWSHGFEFYQTEGIVVDEGLTFRHLLGYLEEFYKKMGFEKIRFSPAYFPYTEPSVEISVFHTKKKKWIELGGAGIFRPEVTIPLLGEAIPVLAWGQGFDRIITDYYEIKDLREMYENDLKKLRNKKIWRG